MADLIAVSPHTLDEALAGLPRPARLALSPAAHIRRGTLRVELPGGRVLVFNGPEPGPTAHMIVKDLGFAWRVIRGGDIGVAEAYLRGEWDTPDLTQFLYLF